MAANVSAKRSAGSVPTAATGRKSCGRSQNDSQIGWKSERTKAVCAAIGGLSYTRSKRKERKLSSASAISGSSVSSPCRKLARTVLATSVARIAAASLPSVRATEVGRSRGARKRRQSCMRSINDRPSQAALESPDPEEPLPLLDDPLSPSVFGVSALAGESVFVSVFEPLSSDLDSLLEVLLSAADGLEDP